MARGKPVILPSRSFANQKLAGEYFAAMLKRYRPGDRVSDEDAIDLAGLVQRHPDFNDKAGPGIDHFEVQSADYGTQCFRVVRADGTWERFSYKTCVAPDQVRD